MSDKQYGHDDARDYEPYFSRHLMAMTTEDLHSKGEIACELAYRDARITQLESDNATIVEDTAMVADENKRLKKIAEAAVRYLTHQDYIGLLNALRAEGYLSE